MKTDGIVLRNQPFGESDCILSIFTKTNGRVSCIAKGAKRSRKRFGLGLQPASYCRFTLLDRGAHRLFRIDSCELLSWWENLYSSLDSFVLSQYGLELIYRLLPEREENQAIFGLLLWFLEKLNRSFSGELIVRTFEARLLCMLGYRPQLSRCGICREEIGEQKAVFVPEQGHVFCLRCSTKRENSISIAHDTITLFNIIVDKEINGVDREAFTGSVQKNLKALLWNFIIYINEGPMNAWKIMP